MKPRLWWPACLVAAAAVTAAPAARALVTLEDGKDQVFVEGSVAFGYNSNVFSNSLGQGSATTSGSLTVEFVRRAGWIGVNANVGWTFSDFGKYPSQDFANPDLSAEFTKETGRTTGALTVSAQHENRADVNVNTVDSSWNYDVGLNVRYPVIERYSITETLDYGYIDYADRTLFDNLATYAASTDLYYILNDERDLFAGYRYRYSDSSNSSYDVDNGVYVGVSGRIFDELNGSLQVGDQIRTPHGDGTGDYQDLMANASTTWNINRRASLTGSLAKDFSTSASDTSIDATTASLLLTYAFNARYSVSTGVGGAENRFLGPGGLIPPDGPERRDYNFNWNAAINYTLNQHLKASLSYVWMRNWSNLAFAVFTQQSTTLTVTSRW